MMSSGRKVRRHTRLLSGWSLAAVLGVAVAAHATDPGKGQPRIGGHVVGVKPLPPFLGPAGPTPLNPAGPTPLNPAGPTPLNPTGAGFGHAWRSVPLQQPGVYVGMVGGGGYAAPLGNSFYCQAHDRGYASQSFFLEHLADADGVYGDAALSYLIEDGGVWIFPVE
jgi:hypothetical protein